MAKHAQQRRRMIDYDNPLSGAVTRWESDPADNGEAVDGVIPTTAEQAEQDATPTQEVVVPNQEDA